jgi:integrase/recombinase XerD
VAAALLGAGGPQALVKAVAVLAAQVQAYLDHLAVEKGASRNTLASYRRDLRRYAAHLADRRIDNLDEVAEGDVAEFVVALQRGDPERGAAALSVSSTARALVAARGLHRFAVAEGMTRVDVARAVKPPSLGKRLPKAL